MKWMSGSTERRFVRLVLALLTIVVVGLLSPTGGSRVRLMSARSGATRAHANADRPAMPPQHHLRDHVARVADFDAVRTELDDDDAFFHAAKEAPVAARPVQAPLRHEGARSAAVARDPSRFAVATDLARGPPV